MKMRIQAGTRAVVAMGVVLLSGGCGGRESAIEARVADAEARLSQSEGGKLILESIEAHGGLQRWFENGPLKFRWTYHMTDRGPDAVVDTVQTIDTWSSRAVHSVPGTEIRFGWDGTRAWVSPPEATLPVPAGFWSLTPYYFIGVPFVLADPGTRHEKAGDIEFEGKAYGQVRVTYESGTGESPDDYYIVLIDPESKRVKGVRYIVTYAALLKDGKPGPEKLLTYEDYTEIGGVLLPGSHRSFTMEGETVGEQIRRAEMTEVAFVEAGDAEFAVPAGAKVEGE